MNWWYHDYCWVTTCVVHVAQWLAFLPLMLEVLGSFPARGEENFRVSESAFPSVICKPDDTRYVRRPSDRDDN